MRSDTQTLTDVLEASLSKGLGVQHTVARELAEAIMRNAAALGLGGTEYYLPSCSPATRAERNCRIRAEFNGQNLRYVCRKYGVSRATVYRVVKRYENAV